MMFYLAYLSLLSISLAKQITFQQPPARDAPSAPYRPLPWGELNIVHTTDTHGWLRGHLGSSTPEPNYSGDIGDLFSFTHHLKAEALRRGVDLLMVDSGDIHDGNGLVDADSRIRGTTASTLMLHLPYDVLSAGNHELYNYTIAADMHSRLASHLHGRYLTSNTYLSNPRKFLGSPFRRFTTTQGRKLLALGMMFDFTLAAKGLEVQKMKEFVEEEWFLNEVRKEVDVVLLVGHIPASWEEWRTLHSAIRTKQPDVSILGFGGHQHIRDCNQLDARSMTLASGRYLETVGWMSVSGLDEPRKPLDIQRRYLDNNRRTYKFHTADMTQDFDTREGEKLTKQMVEISKSFNLSYTYGQSPENYYLSRYPSDHPRSVFSLLTSEIFPSLIRRPDRPNPQPYMLFNTGSARFDIGKGPFTVDSQSLVFPFINQNLFVPDLPMELAQRLLDSLNEYGEYFNTSRSEKRHTRQAEEEKEVLAFRTKMAERFEAAANAPIGAEPKPDSYGYVTADDCPGKGDDTLHLPLPWYNPPVFLATELDESQTTVDVAFYDFIKPMLLDALNRLQSERHYTIEDVHLYTNHTSNTLLGTYASTFWQ